MNASVTTAPAHPPHLTVVTGRMSEAVYDVARAELRETYGDTIEQAGARFEQELARLFYRSGWTQDELAKKEGKGKSWISQRLIFGRFLTFAADSTMVEKLTERRFRDYWERTESGPNERARFGEVIKLMQAPKRPAIGEAIKESFADGKWHGVATIAKGIDADEDHVRETLDRITRKNTTYFGCKAEKKYVGRDAAYRIFKIDRTISSAEIAEKLAPILSGLEAQGKKTLATMSPGKVSILAHELRKLLKEWTE